ncbi:MAG: Ig-like domain-containing protein [[Eubacterium] sulci]|nr:Ig-like domain-containing protein [[Eubacterium] sulci]
MKKTSIRICLTALIVMIFTSFAFAESGKLELKESYPKDGQKNTSVENVGVKLTFNNKVNKKKNQKANSKCFKILDAKGKELPIKVYFNPDVKGQVLVLYDTVNAKKNAIKGDSKYTLVISKKFVDNDGNTLGKDHKIEFKTLNQSLNNKIYMGMMLLMMVGMFFFASRQAKKHQEEDEDADTSNAPFNPYKEAKRTGRPVSEIIAQHEKEEAKAAKKAARKAAKEADEDDYEEYEEEDNGNFKVKGPRPISEAGGRYITGRKALAEAQAAEEERLAKRRAKNKKK